MITEKENTRHGNDDFFEGLKDEEMKSSLKNGEIYNDNTSNEAVYLVISLCYPNRTCQVEQLNRHIDYAIGNFNSVERFSSNIQGEEDFYFAGFPSNGNIPKLIAYDAEKGILFIGLPQIERLVKEDLQKLLNSFGCFKCSISYKKHGKDVQTIEYNKKDISRHIIMDLKEEILCPINLPDLLNILNSKSIYWYKDLVMRNVDSDVDIDEGCLEYMNQIVSSWLSKTKEEMPIPTDTVFKMMPFPNIIPNIPILLRKNKEMPSFEKLWKDIEEEDKYLYMPKGKLWGYYSKEEKPLCEGPHIVLCPENIKESAEVSNIPFKVLMAKVLVHELAHALMDSSEGSPTTLEAKAMEESLANGF